MDLATQLAAPLPSAFTVLPARATRRRTLRDAVLPAVLMLELGAGVALGAVRPWERSAELVPVSTTSAVVVSEPIPIVVVLPTPTPSPFPTHAPRDPFAF